MSQATRTQTKRATRKANGAGGEQGTELPEPSALPRALALGFLVIILDLWLSQHAGFGFSNTAAFGTIVAAVGLLPNALEWVLRKKDIDEFADRFHDAIRKLLNTKVVVLLWAVALFLMLAYSSVEIVGESTADTGTASISLVGSSNKTKETFGPELKPAQFHFVATSPFGERYRIEAPGYVSASFTVYPINSLRVSLGKDLLPSPSVLFRPSPGVMAFLRTEGSRVRISIRRGARTDSIAGGSGAKSFLVGRSQTITADMLQDWQLELAPMITDETYGPTLLGWKKPVLLTPAAPLSPGASLVAEVFSQAGALAGSADVVLGTDKLVDVEISEVRTP
jgi:hypothetical protein